MNRLFAPWRIEWVEREAEDVDGCVFCELPTRDADRATRIVARSDHAYVMLNNYPYNPGHVMVVPDEHTGDYAALADPVLADHARLTQRTIRALDRALEPAGTNVGFNLGGPAAGGSIEEHLHQHVVPRWGGDTNFMPVISETKVIVEAIDDTYDRLRDAFGADERATDPDAGAIRLSL